jgi:hypothetical protein
MIAIASHPGKGESMPVATLASRPGHADGLKLDLLPGERDIDPVMEALHGKI